MSNSTVLNNAEEVTSAKRLTMEQAQALYGLIATFRPDWDRSAVLRQMQITALYGPLEAHEVAVAFITAAATVKPFEELTFPGVDPLRNQNS
ncbi:hypothetical protein SAMN04487914_13239 [Arthrobacter sp. ok909]|uniref:hypothetical protein n=1 Tax=Arthrobacter sp. ok909 TaxID=1761746 RepID=UPI00088E5207|nr:hypothetical protein [Arthrobacter sp. ok909]SDP74064.1 hypothetical protein SAMN04487914_13239 [Arthrobacter sp. ok909]